MVSMKISTAIEGFLLDKQLDLSEHTIAGYKVILRRLVDFVQDGPIERITPNDIRRFLAHLQDTFELGNKSLLNAWVALSSLWTWAEVELKVQHVIKGRIKRPRHNKPVIETFSQDEIRDLLKAAEFTKEYTANGGKRARNRRPTANRDRAIILVLLDTGIRAQELCSLTVADYDEKRSRLHIRRGKGDKARYVILGNRAKKVLWKYMAGRGKLKPTAPLFATKTGEHMQRDNLRHTLQVIAEQAEVAVVYPHKFRHTFAINFLRNGGNALLLKELLGHETLEMTMRYARVVDQDIDSAADFSPADGWRL